MPEMFKKLGKFQLNRRFLILLDRTTRFLIKEKIWDNVSILVTDIDANQTYHFIAESDLFMPIKIGVNKIPSYEIVIYTSNEGYFSDFRFQLIKE